MTVSNRKGAFGLQDLAEFRARIDELRRELDSPTAADAFVAYTDGACLGNPEGPGGWAAVVDRPDGATPWLLYGHLSSTSNNRAEVLGVLAAIEWIPADSRLEVHSDSELTVRILQGRYKMKANPDIWEQLRRTVAEKRVSVTPEWVRGHAGDPRNELADRLTRIAALNRPLSDLAAIDAPAPPDSEPAEMAGLVPRGDWEQKFVGSLKDQLRRGRKLSEKQQAIVAKMRARAERSQPSVSGRRAWRPGER
jgi:ribonuclease HI